MLTPCLQCQKHASFNSHNDTVDRLLVILQGERLCLVTSVEASRALATVGNAMHMHQSNACMSCGSCLMHFETPTFRNA